MDWTWYCAAKPGFSSTLTLATLTRPACSVAISSSTGASILQGPHHSAQKSTSTGWPDFRTSASKLVSFSSTIDFMFASSLMVVRKNRSRRQDDDRAVLPHGLLTGVPGSHRPDYLRRHSGEKQVRILRLPGRRLGFIQGQPDQPFRRRKHAAVFRKDRFFDPGNLRPYLPAGRPAGFPGQTAAPGTQPISICACLIHRSFNFQLYVISTVT